MSKSRDMCQGCYDDFYNRNRTEGCWSFASAVVVKRVRVGTWQNPPYLWQPVTCLSCYHPEGSVMLDKTDCRVVPAKQEATGQ